MVKLSRNPEPLLGQRATLASSSSVRRPAAFFGTSAKNQRASLRVQAGGGTPGPVDSGSDWAQQTKQWLGSVADSHRRAGQDLRAALGFSPEPMAEGATLESEPGKESAQDVPAPFTPAPATPEPDLSAPPALGTALYNGHAAAATPVTPTPGPSRPTSPYNMIKRSPADKDPSPPVLSITPPLHTKAAPQPAFCVLQPTSSITVESSEEDSGAHMMSGSDDEGFDFESTDSDGAGLPRSAAISGLVAPHSGLEAQDAADYEWRLAAGEAREARVAASRSSRRSGQSSDDEDSGGADFTAAIEAHTDAARRAQQARRARRDQRARQLGLALDAAPDYDLLDFDDTAVKPRSKSGSPAAGTDGGRRSRSRTRSPDPTAEHTRTPAPSPATSSSPEPVAGTTETGTVANAAATVVSGDVAVEAAAADTGAPPAEAASELAAAAEGASAAAVAAADATTVTATVSTPLHTNATNVNSVTEEELVAEVPEEPVVLAAQLLATHCSQPADSGEQLPVSAGAAGDTVTPAGALAAALEEASSKANRFADAPLEPYSPDKLSLAAACVQQYEAEQRDMRLRAQARARQLDQLFDELEETATTTATSNTHTTTTHPATLLSKQDADHTPAALSPLSSPAGPHAANGVGGVYVSDEALSSVDEDLCVFLGVHDARRVSVDGTMDGETAAEVAAFLRSAQQQGQGQTSSV